MGSETPCLRLACVLPYTSTHDLDTGETGISPVDKSGDLRLVNVYNYDKIGVVRKPSLAVAWIEPCLPCSSRTSRRLARHATGHLIICNRTVSYEDLSIRLRHKWPRERQIFIKT